MKKYNVSIIETIAHDVIIEADSELEARKELRRRMDAGTFDWSNGDYVDFKVTDIETIE